MSRKKKRARQRRKPRPTVPPRFAVGERVRVKAGVKDPDFPDIPLGGWAGTIREVNPRSNPPLCLIEWNARTLEQVHPVYRKRCERDGLAMETAWLREEEVEADPGEPAVIEQPANIVTRPLRMSDQDDRIRAVFGLTSDDPLPDISAETVRRYRQHLAAHLSFPFRARCHEEIGPFQTVAHPVTVVGLLDAEECDEEDGVTCAADCGGEIVEMPLADLEAIDSREVRRAIDDYSYWFGNWPIVEIVIRPSAPLPPPDVEPAGAETAPPHVELSRSQIWDAVTALAWLAAVGAMYGVVVGALLEAVEGSRIGALVGGVLLALLGCWIGTGFGRQVGRANRMRYGAAAGGTLGAFAGGVVGVPLGVLIVAFLGTLPGAIAGALLGRLVKGGAAGVWVGALVGAGVGAVWLAFTRDPEAARTGVLHGAWMGAAGGVVLGLASAGFLTLAESDRGRQRER
jgi:hypothetical protein